MNWGNSHYDQANPNPFNGPMGSVVPLRGPFRVTTTAVAPSSARDIVDGLSHTMMMSEVIVGRNRGTSTSSDVRGDLWSTSPGGGMFMAYTPPKSQIPDSLEGRSDCQYPAVPTNPPCVGGVGPVFGAARSFHRGGVNVLFADGSVKSVTDRVDVPAWRALSTTDGGVALSADRSY